MHIRNLIKADIMNSYTDMIIKQQEVTFWGRKNSVYKTTRPHYTESFPLPTQIGGCYGN
jgi:hypothetical protein